jgi:hypothetical protein
METKKGSGDEKASSFYTHPFLIALVVLALTATTYITYRLYRSDHQLISISFFALFAGLLFECRRLTKKWSDILPIMFWSWIISFLTFLPGKREDVYVLENHIVTWPYVFLTLFIFGYIIFFKEKVTFKLSEGFTLLQTIAVIYWFVDIGFADTGSLFSFSIMLLGLLCSLYAAFHAFTYTHLTSTHRLWLSIWSSIVMLLFSVENIYITFSLTPIENTNQITQSAYVALQYFLLGISSIYMMQNCSMLIQFLPSRYHFFNAAYFRIVRETKEEHIERYSDQQVRRWHSLLVVAILSSCFILNYYYSLMPRHLAIWCGFIVLPLLFKWANSPKHISVS